MTIEQLYQVYLQHPSIQTDTRKLKQGDIFFALKGSNFNGNQFALQALQAGAAYAVIDEDLDSNNERLIKTGNVLATLQQLAKHHRVQFNNRPHNSRVPFIAITGSNGKTTTKELVSSVLSSHYKTYTTEGNLNNHIGIPLTILNVRADARMAVIEMGANHQKEIAGYCTYTLPTHGIVTNCGKAHLEGFGSIDGVRKGKGELYDFIRATDGTVFIYRDYEYLQDMSKGIRHLYEYGTTGGAVQGIAKPSGTFLTVEMKQGVSFDTITTQLVGGYNLPNVLCAVAVGKYFDVPDEKIKAAIENYTPSNSRSQLVEKETNKIILDAYNANPASMKAAIENFAKMRVDNKVLILGAMMELGKESMEEHKAIIHLIQKHQWKEVVLVGGDYKNIPHPFMYFQNAAEAKSWFQKQYFEHTHFLIKGSRSMQMEKILEN